MFGAGKAKKPQPATRSSTPEEPVPVGTGVVRFLVWAFSATLKPDGAAGSPRTCARGSNYCCSSSGTRSSVCAMRTDSSGFAPLTELDFCDPSAFLQDPPRVPNSDRVIRWLVRIIDHMPIELFLSAAAGTNR
jgi:hypothetical protein